MGRQKKTPIRLIRRQQNHHDDGNNGDALEVQSEVLGRLHHQDSSSLDFMLATELAEEMEGNDDGDSGDYESSRRDTGRKNVNWSNEDGQKTVATDGRKMPPLLSAIEQRIEDNERAQRARMIGKEKKKQSTKRTVVRFAEVSSTEVEIPAVEDVIVRNQDDGTTVLECCSTSDDDVSDIHHSTTPHSFLVATLELPRTRMVRVPSTTTTPVCMSEMATATYHPVTTAKSIRYIWDYFSLPGANEIVDNLIHCVGANWVYLSLSSSSSSSSSSSPSPVASQKSGLNIVLLKIFVSEIAVEGCRERPMGGRRDKYGKKYATANALTSVMEILLDRVSNDGVNEEISAKRVYELVDNKQIECFGENGEGNDHHKKEFPTLLIGGLVPTLRPYQAAAVQWMLDRERSPSHGDEWKVAWLVVLPTTRQTVPLVDWERTIPATSSDQVWLYCPFAGLIAETIEGAKEMTLVGILEPTRGGILAESMGLGKTVEMLACILANPMPYGYTEERHVTNANLRSDDNTDLESRMIVESSQDTSRSEGQGVNSQEVGIVNDMTDFGDDDSSIDEGDVMTSQDANTTIPGSTNRELSVPGISNQERPKPMAVEERWLDDREVGSCICGDLIGFPTTGRKQNSKVIVCGTCHEPMHFECCGIDPPDQSNLNRLNLRRTFGNETLECVLCDECPSCIVGSGAIIKSRATLIICPPAILEQWEREIMKHTIRQDGQALNVLVYHGVEKTTKKLKKKTNAMRLIHPKYLANADIVLMSFEALMADLGHSDDNRYINPNDDGFSAAGNLRKRKRYRIVPSPLSSIRFWRVCIDEAQRVEHSTSKSARMALKLAAVHRWAISGTPIGHGKLEDLYGLLLFLRLVPFDSKSWFNNCMKASIKGVDSRIQELLRSVFWRSTKAFDLVRIQIGIPDMKEERVLLKFSSIERHFYSQQLEKTLLLATDYQENGNGGAKKKSSRLNFLADHLQSLRAACCHPQVGASGVAKVRGRHNDSGVASRVMTMEQILDRFIDDSRHKCEEAQRLAIMHTNAMAALTRLQVEAKLRGVKVSSEDFSLWTKSGDLYREAIDLARKNGAATLVSSEAKLSGNIGFCSPDHVFRNGKVKLEWKIQEPKEAVWARIDFQGPSRRLTKLRMRSLKTLPCEFQLENSVDFNWKVLVPTKIVLQVASAATGGEFVDVASGEFPCDDAGGRTANETDWMEISDFGHAKKSKNWRIVAETPCITNEIRHPQTQSSFGYFVGLEVEAFEAEIGCDTLQLLHSLHNACLSYEAAIQIPSVGSREDDISFSFEEMYNQIACMRKEADQIESLYKTHSQSLHTTCMLKLHDLVEKRQEKEKQLFDVTCLTKPRNEVSDCWDDGCFDDFLGLCCLYGTEAQQNLIFDRIIQDVEGIHVDDDGIRFPAFNDLAGLRIALQMRISSIRMDGLGKKMTTLPATTADNEFVQVRSTRYKCGRGEHASCMEALRMLPSDPDSEELYENSHCRLCKADWNQTGPICRHCKISEVLQDLRPDSVTIAILTAVYAAMRTPTGTSFLASTEEVGGGEEEEQEEGKPVVARGKIHILERARLFFEVLEAEEREKVGAWRMWRVHLDLMNDFDELSSCKQSIRLAYEGEDMTRYTEDQLNAIVQPMQIMGNFHDHSAKQAMALGDLRRVTGTLRYLMNQNKANTNGAKATRETCVVCLGVLDGECAVLRCGHQFHQKPCFDQILARSGNPVSCPMKCHERTYRNDVMIATSKANDDGSGTTRKVKGSYGTKVTRIVSDILTMRDRGEKGVVFSQWNDMLEIVESALSENGIVTVRPTGANKFGDSVRKFSSLDCDVLLLNLKQGAEGLTLTMATHVYMVEPVMNAALDMQAINRIHRIGQTRQTHVWRYLVEDTIEIKLDRMRLKHQDDDEALGNLAQSSRRTSNVFSVGGLDGCFESRDELLEVLAPSPPSP